MERLENRSMIINMFIYDAYNIWFNVCNYSPIIINSNAKNYIRYKVKIGSVQYGTQVTLKVGDTDR